jgi:hypothetical protein
MSNSALAKTYIPAASSNHWGSRKVKIKKIIVHHMAATWTAKRCAESFADPKRKASATYCIGIDGEIVRGLDENITPGTSGGYEADKDAVTIEVANSKMGEPWAVSDKALNSLILLCADIAKRNGLGKLVKGQNLCWHSMYDATACPGTYLLSKMNYIATEANKINYPTTKAVKEVAVNGINIQRKADFLVVYAGKATTGTNKWGTEVAFNSSGVATSAPVYGKGNMAIPSGGFVLSGHGKQSTWILENIKKGSKISLSVAVK